MIPWPSEAMSLAQLSYLKHGYAGPAFTSAIINGPWTRYEKGIVQGIQSPESVLAIAARPRLEPSEIDLLRKLASSGAKIVAWQHPPIVQERFPSPDVAAALSSIGLKSIPLAEALGDKGNVAVDEAVIAWMKAFGGARLSPEGSFRSLFRYRKLSLWWWAELFLYHDTPFRLFVRDVEAMARLLEQERPDRVVLFGPVRDLRNVAAGFPNRVEVHGKPLRFPEHRARTSLRFVGALVKTTGTSLKAVFRRAPQRSGAAGSRLLFLTHASMWREKQVGETGASEFVEMYLGQILEAFGAGEEEVRVIGVGPLVPFRQRGIRATLRDVLELDNRLRPFVSIRRYFSFSLGLSLLGASMSCWKMWRRFCRLPFLEHALQHRGVHLPKQALASFRETFLLQLPWAIRSYREIEASLLQERPALLVLYAEHSGLGRAAVAAACGQGIPSFAVQHGILYPRFYANEHSRDEMGPELDGVDSVPIPTRTAVFGTLARDLLVDRGGYPPERLVVTGSPKFDALVEAGRHFSKEETRRRLGLALDVPVLVVASRFTAIGSVFAELVRAAEAIDNLWLLVKPHQAERSDTYAAVGARERASRLRIVPPEENLLELLFASDGLVTVDSFASSEALVLGRPVMVVNLPSNLSALVERGVALGVQRGESIEDRLRGLLFDGELRLELERQRRKYMEEFAYGADGSSTARIVNAIREVAAGKGP